jgi:amidase
MSSSRTPLLVILVCATLACTPAVPPVPETPRAPFSVVEATIPEMQAAMREGRTTSREIVTQYLTRIAIYEDAINAIIAVNHQALEQADALDF